MMIQRISGRYRVAEGKRDCHEGRFDVHVVTYLDQPWMHKKLCNGGPFMGVSELQKTKMQQDKTLVIKYK